MERIILVSRQNIKISCWLGPVLREHGSLLGMRLTQAQLLTMKSMLLSSFRKYSISFSKRCSSLHTCQANFSVRSSSPCRT